MNIVFDIGGTNMRVAAANGTELKEIKKIPTPKGPKDGIVQFFEIAKAVSAGQSIEAAAGCFAGRVDARGKIHGARNLPAWEGINIIDDFSKGLGVQVRIFNDAILAGLGEARQGAGKGHSVIAYLTVSTGVGGARIVADGAVETSPLLGDLHLAVGDLESVISGTAVTKKFGIHPRELESLEERNKLADILAEGLADIYKEWKPDVFVIGGSMIVGVNPIPLERVRETFTTVPVKMAELGDNGGLIGGAILASRQVT